MIMPITILLNNKSYIKQKNNLKLYSQNLITIKKNGPIKIINNSHKFQPRPIILCNRHTKRIPYIQTRNLNNIINKSIIWCRHWYRINGA